MSKIGIIGVNGNMGYKRLQALNLIYDKDYCEKNIMLCDLGDEFLFKDFGKMDYTNDYKEIIKNDNIEKVVLSVPNSKERDKIIMKLLESRKHILVEKPLAFDREVISNFFNIAAKNKVFLKVAYNLDYFPGFSNLKKETESLGNIILFNGFYGNGWLNPDSPPQNWILSKDAQAGVENYMGCHMLSLLWNIIPSGQKKIDNKIYGTSTLSEHYFDSSIISMKVGNVLCNITVSWSCWQNKFELNVIGTNGMVSIDSMVKYIKYGQKGEKFTHVKRTSKMPEIENKTFNYDNVDKDSADLEFLDIEMKDWMEKIKKRSFDNEVEFEKNIFIHDCSKVK